MPPLDALAARLLELQDAGSIVRSSLSNRMRERLQMLFHYDMLRDVKEGGGWRVVLRDREALENWIRNEYPSGLTGSDADLTHRTLAVANYRDSKRNSYLRERPMHMRGFGDATLTRNGTTLPIAELTRTADVVGITINQDAPWRITGSLALVENVEVFMQVERILPTIDAALLNAGRIDQRALDWLASQPDVRVMHVGDYDPVGLSEYLRVRAAIGDRAQLHIPTDLEERVIQYGQRLLLEKSSDLYQDIRRSVDPSVARVVAILDRHGRALEHEALLIDAET